MKRTRTPRSSNIYSVGYDVEKQELEIEFGNRVVYRYEGVPPEVHEELLRRGLKPEEGESAGSYVHLVVKKYPSIKVPALTGDDPCPGCEHLLRYHYFDVTAVPRCLVVDRGESTSGIIGMAYEILCDCSSYESPQGEAKRERKARREAVQQELVDKMVEGVRARFEEAGDDVAK